VLAQKCLLRSACSEVLALKDHNIIIDNNNIEINKTKLKKDLFKEYKEKIMRKMNFIRHLNICKLHSLINYLYF